MNDRRWPAFGIRAKLRRQVVPFLAEGEEVQAVIAISRGRALGPYLFATDRRYVLVATNFWLVRLTEVIDEFPRTIRLGPPHGRQYRLWIPDYRLYVPRRFFTDLEKADALLDGLPDENVDPATPATE